MKEVTFHLEVFDGPLDLLLHLLSKNKVEITDIPIAEILEQYLAYIRQMQEFDLEVASEFITMAAQLMYIKSKMLLPVYQDEEAEDPRAGLVEALLEYQQFREAGTMLGDRSALGRDLFVKGQEVLEKDPTRVDYHYTYDTLTKAIETILQRSERKLPPPVTAFRGIIGREAVPVEDKIRDLIRWFTKQEVVCFEDVVLSAKSRSEVVAIFLAVLELSKTRKIHIEDGESGYLLTLAPAEAAAEEPEREEETHGPA